MPDKVLAVNPFPCNLSTGESIFVYGTKMAEEFEPLAGHVIVVRADFVKDEISVIEQEWPHNAR